MIQQRSIKSKNPYFSILLDQDKYSKVKLGSLTSIHFWGNVGGNRSKITERYPQMSLTYAKCISTKAESKLIKLFDGNGLYLEVRPTGRKFWRMKYRFDNKEKLLTIGEFPRVEIKKARKLCAEAKEQLKLGLDPSVQKQLEKTTNLQSHKDSFELVMEEWHKANKKRWNETYAETINKRIKRHVIPKLGKLPITSIDTPTVLDVVRQVENQGTGDLHTRILQYINQVFIYGMASGKCKNNPAAGLTSIVKPASNGHYGYLKADDLPEFFKRLKEHQCSELVKIGLELILLTGVRSNELRFAIWDEIDFKDALWSIPKERMKMKRPHTVPLSKQALKKFKRLKEMSNGRQFIFPNERNLAKPMSENALLYALYRMGYRNQATVHGFRATMSTILNEQGFKSDLIEKQLAHVEGNKVRAAYNHAEYLEERREMMQKWADWLDSLSIL